MRLGRLDRLEKTPPGNSPDHAQMWEEARAIASRILAAGGN